MNGKSFDKLMHGTAYAYIATPFLIFAAGYLRWYLAVPVCLIVIYSLYRCIRDYRDIWDDISPSQNIKTIVFALLIIFIWIFLSGIGGYCNQTYDFEARNAIFHDLIEHSWPVTYNCNTLDVAQPGKAQSGMLVYYIGYWLPAALIGKIGGWKLANFALYIWTVIGIWIIYYLLCRFLKRFSLKFLFVLIFWSGASVIGILLKFSFVNFISSEYNLYAGSMISGYNTGNLFSLFNQIVVPWMIILLFLNNAPPKNIVFLYALCLFFGPFAFLGLSLYMVCFVLFNSRGQLYFNLKTIFDNILIHISFANTLGFATVFGVSYLFLKCNTNSGQIVFVHRDPILYAEFVCLEFAIPVIIIFNKFRNNFLLYLLLFYSLTVPFGQVGGPSANFNRLVVPSVFILMLLVLSYLIEEKRTLSWYLLAGYILVAALLPTRDILRSAFLTGAQNLADANAGNVLVKSKSWHLHSWGEALNQIKGRSTLVKDDMKTLCNPPADFPEVYFIAPMDKSFFYKYMAKRK